MATIFTSYPYLRDRDFLKELDEQRIRAIYTKIELLDWNEDIIETIEGEIVSGSFTIDGASSVRRTGNMSFVYKYDTINYINLSFKFSLNKKIFPYVGVKNNTNKYTDYPIIWYPMGLFLITGCSISHSAQGVTVNLNLKDKMALLNGECGGTLPASVTFSEIDIYDEENEMVVTKNPTMYQIITEAVNHWGKEQLGKILIQNLDTRTKAVVKWGRDVPLWVRIKKTGVNGTREYQSVVQTDAPTDEKGNLEDGYVKYEYGQDCGYQNTDFTYPGELVGDAGAPLTDILDKIKNTLGNYEYYYDIDGNFRFQEIKNYLNTSLASDILAELKNVGQNGWTQDTVYYYDSEEQSSKYIMNRQEGESSYLFTSELVTNFSNSPDYSNIKNDFIVWGMRKSIDGTEFPIRYHLAIDTKPHAGTCYKYKPSADDEVVSLDAQWDRYYIKDLSMTRYRNEDELTPEEKEDGYKIFQTTDWRTQLYMNGAIAEVNGTDPGDYYAELANEWPKYYDFQNKQVKDYYKNNPQDLDFFLDFIDSSEAWSNYAISKIGKRSKVLVDDSINCLFEPPTPDVVFVPASDGEGGTSEEMKEAQRKNQVYAPIENEYYDDLILGRKYNGADIAIQDLLYQYTTYNENISFTTVPIYWLEPNTRITVLDDAAGISGDFIIKTISIQLGHSGSTNITACRALTKI